MSTVIALHPRTRQQHTRRQHTRPEQSGPALRVVPSATRAVPAAGPTAGSTVESTAEWTAEGTAAATVGHPLRLTRRGRFVAQVAVTVLVLVMIAAGVLLLNKPAEAGQQAQSVPVAYHVVLPGETMWQIAGEVAPGVDRRDTVDDLMELNALSTSAVAVGQKIAYPVTASRP